jgi:eukaryotic-like serine/threonine-protein kinase
VSESPAVQTDTAPAAPLMHTIVKTCRRCGAKLFGNGKGCSACMLETAVGWHTDHDRETAPEPRREFGDYELLEEIGRGGQAVVYRARQKSLNRTVALKLIGLGKWSSTPQLKRFRQEAEAAASLAHPQIVPIYEIGDRDGFCYFSMQFIEGGQLDEVLKRQPCSARHAAELLVGIARSVQFAHEHGILHRDIKPGNILLDRNGEPHLTDFGLARLIEQESTITHSADVVGTPSYMSPEQAAGDAKKVTPATDVYALGAVFYHMLTGQPPFAGNTSYETVRMVLNSEPRNPRMRNPKVDADLATICLKCLEKDPARRYQSAEALATDVEHWLRREPIQARRVGVLLRGKKWLQRNPATAITAVSVTGLLAAVGVMIWTTESTRRPSTYPLSVPNKSIAVLPFENLSRDPDNAYLAEGIQSEILTRLSKIADLKVISRTSTQHYKSAPDNLSQVARQLGVANILEGTVQKSGDAVRVNVQLIKADTDSHLWADTFDQKFTNIFAVESKIATRIAETLQARLTGADRNAIAKRPTANTEAYALYLKGRFFWNKRTGADLRTAIYYFNQALGKDPGYALAYAGLADSYAILPRFGAASPADSLPHAKAAAKKALELDDTLAEAHTSLAFPLAYYDCDFEQSAKEFERAIHLNPNYATAHHWYGELLAQMGRFDEAIAEFKRAQELDPLSLIINADLGEVYRWARQYDKAIEQLRKTLEMDPRFYYAHWNLGIALQLKGELSTAIGEYRKAVELNDDPFVLALLGQAYARAGEREEAQKILARLSEEAKSRYVYAYSFALMFLALGDKDRAIDEMEEAYRERNQVFSIKVDAMLDDLRGNPRFEAIVQKVFAPKMAEAESR